MTVFDYLVLLILVCSIVISTLRGLIKEILSLLSWIVAFVIANAYSDVLATWLPSVVPGQMLRLIVAFIALFIGVRLIMALIMLAVDALIKASGLTLADRGLGGLFGLARGCILVLAGVLLCGMTSIPQQAFWTEAWLSPLAETAARTVIPLLPTSVSEHVKF
ncbi:CvpA family protein [Undibacterium umbellatum]|uniref:CvpA family protein n=1 Tax=Undibacterium umbellatum TaxID=2762300 RepID=A0ABR6Z3X4_9BURK|nr:CvpA family protein [Undibacterium umbellatum]MBC3906483.1 CvpA family protein [Undibacterium umbellatum]